MQSKRAMTVRDLYDTSSLIAVDSSLWDLSSMRSLEKSKMKKLCSSIVAIKSVRAKRVWAAGRNTKQRTRSALMLRSLALQ